MWSSVVRVTKSMMKDIQKRHKASKHDSRRDELEDASVDGEPMIMPGTTYLPTTMDSHIWNIDYTRDVLNNPRLIPGPEYITVMYPAGGYRSQAGVNIKFRPRGFPCTQICLSYHVFVPPGWDCKKGGKLPGFFFGKKGAGGKTYEPDNGSCRLMWRKNRQLVPYVYLCTDQGDISSNQSQEFLRACGHTFPEAGIDLWRYTNEKLFLLENAWNAITLGATLNDVGGRNGSLWVELNGTRLHVGGICFTAKPHINKFYGLQFSTWYGGSNSTWAPDTPQQLWFTNICCRTG